MKFKAKAKKLIVTTGVLLMLALSTATTAYAAGPSETTTTSQAQQQSPRWQGAGDTWRLKTADGVGYLTNSWFQDLDSSWYMLGSDGVMYSGLITDQSTGKSYLLNVNHDGTYGRMLTQDGAYTINNKQVYLTFNQSHDGTFGAIQQGLSEARGTGIRETQLASIPTDSASTQTQQEPKPNNNGEFCEGWRNKPYDQWTRAERDQRSSELEGGRTSTAHPDDCVPPNINWGH